MPISAAISGCSLSILLILFAVAAAFACSQMPSLALLRASVSRMAEWWRSAAAAPMHRADPARFSSPPLRYFSGLQRRRIRMS